MTRITSFIKQRYKFIIITGLVLILIINLTTNSTLEPRYSIIEPVTVGTVSSNISAQGTISSAQKIDLNVYKQAYRLDSVTIQNGLTVQKDDVLFRYDADDINTHIRAAQLQVRDAKLAYEEAVLKNNLSNYDIETQENSLTSIQNQLTQIDIRKAEAKRTYFSTDLEFIPADTKRASQITKTAPTVTGQYTGADAGEYTIEIYRSGASSGYSYRINGLETGLENVYPDTKRKLGTMGLEITFPADISGGDTWLLKIPNTDASTYLDTKKTYDDTIRNLTEATADNRTGSLRTQQQIDEAKRTDTATYRALAVDQAALAVDQAYEALRVAQRDVNERTITAPFSGTINGMRNVVAGTKVRTDDETVQFGTLLSDTFLVTFSLRIGDVTRVAVGDEVSVAIPALPEQANNTALISEISALPNDNNTYEIRATMQISTSTREQLREGVLADISIAQESVANTVRVPRAALRYEDGKPYVEVVRDLPEVAQTDIAQNGSADFTQFNLIAEKRFIETGLTGERFVAVTSGLQAGDFLLTAVETGTSKLLDPFDDFDDE